MTELTKARENLMKSIVNDYTSTRPINEEEIDKGLTFIYKVSGLKKPDFKIFDSPIKMFKYLLDNIHYYPNQEVQVDDSAADSLYIARIGNLQYLKDVNHTYFPVFDEHFSASTQRLVNQEVRQRVRAVHARAIRQAESELNVRGSIISEVRLHDNIAYRDFFYQIDNRDNTPFKEYTKFIKNSGIFIGIYLYDIALLCKNPILMLKDEKNRLHNMEGPAIQWVDGYSQHYVSGVSFDNDLFNRIFIKNEITPEEIVALTNTEQKVVAIQHYGYDKLISELNAKKLDEWKTKSLVNGNVAVCELFEFELNNKRSWTRNIYRFVKVQDHSTGKITTLGVPVENSTKTAKGAVAWTFGMTEEQYNPYLET